MLQYFALFNINRSIYLAQIPQTSANILIDFNKRLYLEGSKPSTKLYRTDSLSSVFSLAEKSSRGNYDYPAFVSTDPNDESKGHDTLITVTPMQTLNDSSNYQYLYFTLHGNANNLHLAGISSSYMLPIQLFQISFYHGFMNYKTILSLNATEKSLLESTILFQIETRLLPQGGELDTYLEKFNLKEEELARRL